LQQNVLTVVGIDRRDEFPYDRKICKLPSAEGRVDADRNSSGLLWCRRAEAVTRFGGNSGEADRELGEDIAAPGGKLRAIAAL